MTREEAIELLRSWDGVYIGYSSDEVEEALNMAIQALSQEPCEWGRMTFDPTTGISVFEFSDGTIKQVKQAELEPCEDAVSRAELLKAIDTWDKFGYTETGCFVREPKGDYVPYIHYDDVIKCIQGMPTVTPKPIECDDAEQIDYHDDFATALKKMHEHEERQTGDDWRKGFLAGMDHCIAIIKGESRQKGGKEWRN